MKIKNKDIALALGISEATVSLAVNDRPGVNPETKQKVLDYITKRELSEFNEKYAKPESIKGSVMVLTYKKNGSIMERADELHVGVKRRGGREYGSFSARLKELCRSNGYKCIFREFLENTETFENLIKEIKDKNVKGIYIYAAEMSRQDILPFTELNIPLVVGDNLFYKEGADAYLVDNEEGIRRAVDTLVDCGHSDILYMAENSDIFNFRERRAAFEAEMVLRNCPDPRKRIIHLGSEVQEISQNMDALLEKGLKHVTAFVLESSYVSVGVIKSLLAHNIKIPRQISLIGFDALPGEDIPGIELTLIKGTHTKRHYSGVQHLINRIEHRSDEIMKVYYKTRLIEGNSVFDKTKYIYV
ncbi:MAG: LacI family transcriptional regulator [Lachnospiraceae bacterium]|nr:LacI family transcriptional regulator [Lachnospiraceae bacterium]